MDYSSYKQARQELENLVQQQLDVVGKSQIDETSGGAIKPSDTLHDALKSLENGDLNTLVMGRFSTGKSVFLNALMGMDILPSDVRPCTAVIGEISHGADWQITLHARDTKPQPVQVKLHELKDYITIPHDSGQKQNAYAKVEIQAPIPVFSNGIRFVDSPGLDDPTSHDEVTTTYLPKADAVVYVMNCASVYSKSDKVMIDELRALGHTSLIFVMTFFDQLEMNDMMYGTDDAEKCKQYCIQKLSPLTDLGEAGIFFVNSRAALKAKTDNNAALLERSHFPEMEMKLEQILAAEKGRMKLCKIFTDVKTINDKCTSAIQGVIKLAGQKHEQLRANVEKAKLPLKQAEASEAKIYQTIEKSADKFRKTIRKKGELYYSSFLVKVEDWIKNQPCENSIKLLSPKESSAKFVNELLNEVKVCMMKDIREWGENELNAEVADFIDSLSLKTDRDISACMEIVDEVNKILQVKPDDVVNSTNASTGEKVLAAGVGLLLGDIYGAAMGGISGFGGLIRTLTCELVGIAVLLVASYFTPVGLPAFIISAVLSAIAGGAWTSTTLEPKARKKVAEKFSAELSKPETREEFLTALDKSISNMISQLNTSIQQQVSQPINQARKLLEEAQKIFTGQGAQIKEKIARFTPLGNINTAIATQLVEVEKKYLQ